MIDQKRISWDDLYMAMAFLTCTKSPDPSTKHGCVFVDKDHKPISIGYNGFPSGADDEALCETDAIRYAAVIHSEENAEINAHDNHRLAGGTAYITGMPCSRCLSKMIHLKIARIVIGNVSSRCINDADVKAREILLRKKPLVIESYSGDVYETFDKTKSYMQRKGV